LRRTGISTATFYSWKKRYAGVGVTELRELRRLGEVYNKLKPLAADLALDNYPAGGGRKKAVKPLRLREAARWAHEAFQENDRAPRVAWCDAWELR